MLTFVKKKKTGSSLYFPSQAFLILNMEFHQYVKGSLEICLFA